MLEDKLGCTLSFRQQLFWTYPQTLSKGLGETAKAGGCAAEKEMVNRNVRTLQSQLAQLFYDVYADRCYC